MSDLENLFSAIGFVIVHWSTIELRAAVITNALYQNVHIAGKPGRIPKFLKRQYAFQRHCFYNCVELRSLKDDALRIIEESEQQQELRERLAHSALLSPHATDGVYHFRWLEAQETDHKGEDWDFDVRTFPRLAIELGGLLDGWEALAFAVAQLYEDQQREAPRRR